MPDIDTTIVPFVSFAPLEGRIHGRHPERAGADTRAFVPVGPGRPAIAAPKGVMGGTGTTVADYPIQLNKVQAPPLRDETLARARLLDWLHAKIHRRAVLVLAEAGYGKTTLLADFTRRTHIRIAWYRLDRGDRDWPGFIAHLIAAVRIHYPSFAPIAHAMVREPDPAMPAREAVIGALIRELGALPPEPLALVFDDFHLVDDAPDPREIVRELLARAPDRVSIVLISRKVPPIPLARLRSLGEVAELNTADLRFVPEETEQLFRETFALSIEPSVVAELARRTEGWAASLQLVRTALRDRDASEIRAFVRSLSGAEGDLYDYLAEEVVGELDGEFQQFLMRTSLLEIVDPVLGSTASGLDVTATRRHIAEGETVGLFGRTGPSSRDQVRAHPLVRDFLRARLLRIVGSDEVARIHRAIASAAEPLDWRVAGYHFIAAGEGEDARRVLANAIEAILASGAYSAADQLITALVDEGLTDPNVLVVRSRLAQQRGEPHSARELAEAAYEAHPTSLATALNLQTARFNDGAFDASLEVAATIEANVAWNSAHQFARAVRAMVHASVDGDLQATNDALSSVIHKSERRGDRHYLGVAMLNLGHVQMAMGEPKRAGELAGEAIANLESTSAGIELVSARLLRAWTLAHEGDLLRARAEIQTAIEIAPRSQRVEIAFEGAEIEARYGDPAAANRLLSIVDSHGAPRSDSGEHAMLVKALLALSLGNLDQACALLSQLSPGVPRPSVAFEARRRLLLALYALLTQDMSGHSLSKSAEVLASGQGAHLWARVARLYQAAASGGLSGSILEESGRDRTSLTLAAEVIASRLNDLDERSLDCVRAEAMLRPDRWRPLLRLAVATQEAPTCLPAARLLEEVGAAEDVPLLRRLARDGRVRQVPGSLGKALARRLAPRVQVEDLGRLRISIGTRYVDGASIRRKVLALLCLLLTKHRFAATRDEVLEGLWPDLDPTTALNSLNQTVYFLRRVFEPDYVDDLSPGYVGQDGETVWLDQELLQSRSHACRDLLRRIAGKPDPDLALDLAKLYAGRFALDFAYEDWAGPYRDDLHASYLRAVEAAVRRDTDDGSYPHGIELAELALSADPEAEEIQVALMRLYRLSGSLAAAGEQYQRYSRAMRDLGLEPEPLDII